jgi:hypothetical protein
LPQWWSILLIERLATAPRDAHTTSFPNGVNMRYLRSMLV